MCSLLWYPWAVDLQRNYQWSIFWGENFWKMLFFFNHMFLCNYFFLSFQFLVAEHGSVQKEKLTEDYNDAYPLIFLSFLWIDNSLRLYGKKLSVERESPSQLGQLKRELIWDKVDPFAWTKSLQHRSRMLWLSLLDRADPAGRAKVFIWRKVGLAKRGALPLKSVTLLGGLPV